MKITFVSNYFNHHQRPVSDALAQMEGVRFSFVETQPMREERRQLGYGKGENPAYVLDHKEDADGKEIKKILEDADVVICGSATEEIQSFCGRMEPLLFRYSERPLKNGLQPLKYFPRLLRWHRKNPAKKKIYVLCASAYAAGDYKKFGLFKGRCYKWGYFPQAKRYQDFDGLMDEKNPTEIMWCGRFLDWKHPDDAIYAAKRLKADGYAFRLNMVGRGEMEDKLSQMIESEGLSDTVCLSGSMTPEEVRLEMERAGIFLFTSDRGEGWGAVLNESMNSGCAVVAGHAAGSVPFLLKDGENGCIYESCNAEMLYQKIKYLLDHPEEQRRLGTAAYHTIIEEWNPEVAAERLIRLTERILAGEASPRLYDSGPCSLAETMTDKW